MNIDVLYTYAKKFMQNEFPDEAPYFDIAWDVFKDILKKGKDKDLDLNGPIVRFEGDDTIMAPKVIQAFYMLFDLEEKTESFNKEEFISLAMKDLSKYKFSPEIQVKIVDSFLETRHG